MIGDITVEPEPAEPPVRQIEVDLFAETPLGADTEAVPDDEHPDHQLGINRWPADLTVEWCQLLTKFTQYPRHHRIDPAQQMAHRNAPLEVEHVK